MLRLCFLKLKFKLHWAWSWRLPTPQVQAASVRKASRVLFWVPYDPKQLLSRAGPLELQNGPQTHRTRWKLVSNKHKQTTLAPRDCLAFTCKTHPVGWQTFLNLLFFRCDASSWNFSHWSVCTYILQLTELEPSACLGCAGVTVWDKGVLGGAVRLLRAAAVGSVLSLRRVTCHHPLQSQNAQRTCRPLFLFSKIKHADSTLPPKASPLFLIKFLFAGSRFTAFYAFFLFLQLEPVSVT